MPRGSKGQKRPADVIGNAVHMRIATGGIEEARENDPAKALAKKGGSFQSMLRSCIATKSRL